MLTSSELKRIARARLADSEALLRARRYDGAIYVAGYAVELALKARICKTLRWRGYPSTRKEFENLLSFKSHDLDVLLHLSGAETRIKLHYFADWSAVASWDPEARYKPVGSATRTDALLMVQASRKLLTLL
jgi:HEPN domain-containing protein